MKKTLIALAAVAVSGAAFAQATISGGISVGVVNTGQAGAKAGVASLGGGANAINITTSEDLGGGLSAGFTSQIRFDAATGNMNSAAGAPASGAAADGFYANTRTIGSLAMFHAANVHVGGSFGTVRIGKIAETGICAFDPWGCTAGAGLQAGVGVSALAASGTQANSVSYASPSISGFSVGYQTSVSDRANERSVFNINYSQGPLAVAYVQANGLGNAIANFPTDAAVGATGTAKSTQTAIAASYNLGVATVSLANTVSKNAANETKADIMSLGVTVPMGAITILAGYNKAKTGGTLTATAANDTKTSIGVNYSLSKRTTVGADIFNAEAAGSKTGYVARVRHTF